MGAEGDTMVLQLIREEYLGTEQERFGPTLAAEHLADEDGLQVGEETLWRWMLAEGLWSRKRRWTPFQLPLANEKGISPMNPPNSNVPSAAGSAAPPSWRNSNWLAFGEFAVVALICIPIRASRA
jgi:hypothetical protein